MKSIEPVWVVIHMAHSEARASAAQRMLEEEGFMVRVRPVAKALSSGDACFEVLSLSSEAREARDCLQEAGF